MSMRGAEAMLRTLLASGVKTCFANPGTSEMQFVAALDRVPDMRGVLCLSEMVVTGCADGYGRMTGGPAATLLHCGPGFVNGAANLHNARRARTPIVNLVGDHATWHRQYNPPLASDVEGFARAASDWVRRIESPEQIGGDVAAAVQAARSAPGGIATLIAPADMAWAEGAEPGAPLVPAGPRSVPADRLPAIVSALRSGERAMLLLSGPALLPRGLAAADRISRATGAALMCPTQVARAARGRGMPRVDRMPFAIDPALQALAGLRHMVLCAASPPTAFFAYPGKPSLLAPPDCGMHLLAAPEEDVVDALEALADALGAPASASVASAAPSCDPARGAPTSESIARALTARLPEHAIVVDDAVSTGRGFFPLTFDAAPHDWIQVTGGSIGFALPAAAGAALACPGRKVVCLQGDGGAMYSVPALWTQARERLDVVNVILSNRAYKVLYGEMAGVGGSAGPAARRLMDLTDPTLDWVGLAQAQGVEAARADTMERFDDIFAAALSRPGPMLIELVM
jgi:acetolactate synthase-1/2/3 large subunit